MNLDDALTAYRSDLISAASRWQAARRRRRRRFLVGMSALALTGVVVGTAIATTGWLIGAPAPRSVKSDFGSYATQLGFNPQPGKAVLVAHTGAYKLYATTNKQGGYCTLLSDPWYHPGPHGEGGDCNSSQQASVAFWAGIGGAAGPLNGRTTLVIIGRTRNSQAKSIQFNYPQGKTATTRVGKSGFFITPITITRPIFTRLLPNSICRWSSNFVQLDANGHQLAQKTVTFGPRVCFSHPKPTVTTEGGVKTFTIRLGANGYIAAAQPGDKIACRAAGHTLTVTVPQAPVGHTEHSPLSKDRQLTLSVRHDHKDRIWVSCR